MAEKENKEGSMAESKELSKESLEEAQAGPDVAPVKPASVLPPAGNVVLQVELASKRAARTLQWTAWFLLLALVVVTIIIVAAAGDRDKPRSMTYYRIVLGFAAASVLVALVWLPSSSTGDIRRKSLAVNAAVLIVLGTINLSCWLAGLAVALGAGCTWPFRAIAFLAFFRGITLAFIIFWVLTMMSSMSLKRMRPTVDSNPDEMLILDATWQAKVREHAWKFVVCLALIVMSTLVFVSRISHPRTRVWLDTSTCGELPRQCKSSTSAIFQLAFNSAIILLCFIMFVVYAWRALRDHAKLPYSHYRLTNIFIRVQVRNGSAVLLAVVCGIMAQETAGLGTCVGFIDSQLGSFAVEIAFVVLIFVSVYLYMPAIVATSDVQAWLQEFCWTAASQDSAIAERNAEMASCKAADTGTLEPRLLRMMGLSPEAATGAALVKEPMFCFEWAVRLFYWMRLSYQFGNPNSPVSKEHALPLFGLHDCECMHDPAIDTKALLAWSKGGDTLVLTFRGTASKSNVWTDLRAWKTTYPPMHWRRGLPVKVHTGFFRAWTDNGFRDRFMARVKELAGDCAAPRIFLAGHSLGGALASLAAMELTVAYPDSKVSVYTYGAPRVGNPQFAAEYNKRVPDSWAIINNQDPVPRIPKIGFKSVGKRVTVSRSGDIIVRPSYFELSVLMRSGGSVSHHLTGNYALALAAVLKSQFFESKRLPEGEAGARALAGALDLGGALVLEGLDLASLEDPAQMPRIKEQPKASKSVKKGLLRSSKSVMDMDRQTNLPPEEAKVSPQAGSIGHV